MFLKVLHIDDDPVIRMMVSKALGRIPDDFKVESCDKAEDFLNLLNNFDPHLLLVDVMMPITDGLTLVQKARALGYKVPVVFMTGHENIDEHYLANIGPILGIIHKPFPPLGLGDILHRMWEKFNT